MPGLVPGIRLFRSLEAKSRCPALHRSAVTVCCPKWRPHREEWARDGLVGDASVMERAARLAFLPLSIVVLEENVGGTKSPHASHGHAMVTQYAGAPFRSSAVIACMNAGIILYHRSRGPEDLDTIRADIVDLIILHQ